jgi:hypothetical protein
MKKSPDINDEAIVRKEFLKVKRFIQKRFPGAHTVAKQTTNGFVYDVVDNNLGTLISPDLYLPPASSVTQAWRYAKHSVWFSNMLRKSNEAFNEERMYKKLAQSCSE